MGAMPHSGFTNKNLAIFKDLQLITSDKSHSQSIRLLKSERSDLMCSYAVAIVLCLWHRLPL
jgi:hypothetical protein